MVLRVWRHAVCDGVEVKHYGMEEGSMRAEVGVDKRGGGAEVTKDETVSYKIMGY